MTVQGDKVYVADAENHNIRLVDLGAGRVTTVAGTGEQSLYRHSGGDPLANPINSPYDLTIGNGTLYIAMAGFHQLWQMDWRADRSDRLQATGAKTFSTGPGCRPGWPSHTA